MSDDERNLDEIRLAYTSHADMQWVLDRLAASEARCAALVAANRVLFWELHQWHNLEARHWVTDKPVRWEHCPRCLKLASLAAQPAAPAPGEDS